jgi:plastocyanin
MVLSMAVGGVVLPVSATDTDVASASGDTTPRIGDTIAQTANETDQNNRPPTVEFTVSPTDPKPGDTISFSAEATDPDGEVASHEWRVDGDSIANGSTAEYVFAEGGEYEVRLTVTDDQGGTASLTRLVAVSADEGDSETMPVSEGADPEPNPEFTTDKPARDPVIPFLSGQVELEPELDPAVTDTGRERAWTVFQFHRQPTAEELDFLQSLGYQQRSVLADRTYYAALPPENAPEAIELESVRSIADIDPEWKIAPRLDDQLAETDDSEVPVTVRSFEAIPERADSLGLDRIRERTYRGELTATQVRDLQQRETVRWIEPFDEPEPLLAESVGVIGAQRAEFLGVDGSGVRVGVVDTGIEHGHPHFSGVNIVDSYDENDNDYYPEADNFGWSGNDHGTHVAGTIAGSSVVNGEALVGVAPGATLVIARGLGEDQFARIHKNNTDIISNSWGSRSFTGQYSSDDAYTDRWARDHPQSILVVANGNWNASNPREQFANTPAIAKNAISVGALNDGSRFTDALNNVAWLNNMTGPNDGRQKPDINAPGARITSSVLNSTYGTKVGTSMATPHVSGVAALYEDEYPNRNPDAAEMKAAMVATAGPVQNPNPSERAEGYGAINAHNMLYNNSYESRQLYYQGDLRPPFPTANTHRFDVANDAEKVVVSLSWLDPPGDPATTDTLVNDLDLYVGPTSDPKRYSVTDRDQSINRLVVDNLSPSERGSQWVVTVEPHDMWTGAGAAKARQDYDGKIRVVTEEPELSVDVPDRITVEPQRSVTESFEAKIDATGAPVHGIRAFVESDRQLGSCSGANAHDDEHVVGILSEDYLGSWSEQLCFDVPDEAGTYPVTTRVNYTDQSGQTATIEEETIIEVPKPRVKLEPFERNVTVGEITTYELVAGNLSDGVGEHELYISLDRPPIGALTDFTVMGSPSSETVQVDPSSDKAWISVEADGLRTTDYGTATLGILEAEGRQVGKSNISVEVITLDDELGDAYPLRTQGSTLSSGVPSDGLLNVTRGPIDPGGITIELPPIGGPDGFVVVDTPITIQIDQEAIVSQHDAEAETVEWTFGDGTTGAGLTTEHTYAEPGNYDIVGQIGLDDGRTVELSRTVNVTRESDGAGIQLDVDGSETVVPGENVSLTVELTNTGERQASSGGIEVSMPDGLAVLGAEGDGTGQPARFFTQPIEPGATVTVTYTVSVDPEAELGPVTVSVTGSLNAESSTQSTVETVGVEIADQKGLPTSPGEPGFGDTLGVIESFNSGQEFADTGVTPSFGDVLKVIEAFNSG